MATATEAAVTDTEAVAAMATAEVAGVAEAVDATPAEVAAAVMATVVDMDTARRSSSTHLCSRKCPDKPHCRLATDLQINHA